VFLSDVLQHVLFAQHAGLHALSLATFERIQDRAETGIAAMTIAIPTTNDMAILLRTSSINSISTGRRRTHPTLNVQLRQAALATRKLLEQLAQKDGSADSRSD
jgi:hypothetical protein